MSLVINDPTPEQIMSHWDQHSTRIINRTFERANSRSYMVPLEFKDRYVHHTGTSTEMVQSYQKTWTPKGTVTLKPRVQRHTAWKADLVFDARKYNSRNYLASVAQSGSNPYDMPYMDWIIQTILEQVLEDFELNVVWTGRDLGVIPGAPNPAADVANGLLYKIEQSIAAGEMVPVVTGAMTPGNAVTWVEGFVKGTLNTPTLRSQMHYLHMALDMVDMYQEAYRLAHGEYIHANEFNHLRVTGTNVTIVPHAGLNGHQRVTMTNSMNLFYGYDGDISFIIEREKRNTNVIVDGEFSVDYALAKEVYVNDQL